MAWMLFVIILILTIITMHLGGNVYIMRGYGYEMDTENYYLFSTDLGGLVLLFPLWWMITISLSNPEEAMAGTAGYESFKWIPEHPNGEI